MAATTTPYNPKVRVAQGQLTTAQVNAGTVVVKASKGKTIKVVDFWMRAIGGNAATATSVGIVDTTTGTVAGGMAVGGLTENAVARMGLATHSINTNIGTALGKGQGLKVLTAGSALATATAIDYCIYYIMAD